MSRPAGAAAAGGPPTLSVRFADALAWAFVLHGRQRRKGSGIPYVAHLLAVCSLVLDHGGGEDEAIAGLLHDAVEDQGGAPLLLQIRARFGDSVGDIVAGCTDTDQDPKPPWRPRKEQYLGHLRVAPPPVLLVSAADKLHNARSILLDLLAVGPPLWRRFAGGRDGTLWYYRAVVETLRERGADVDSRLLGELARVVGEIELAAAH